MSATAVVGRNGTDIHGTVTGYSYGCRCEPCRAAKSSANRQTAIRRTARRRASSRDLRLRRDTVLRLASDGRTVAEIVDILGEHGDTLTGAQVRLILTAWA
jgi:hypothetical protein